MNIGQRVIFVAVFIAIFLFFEFAGAYLAA